MHFETPSNDFNSNHPSLITPLIPIQGTFTLLLSNPTLNSLSVKLQAYVESSPDTLLSNYIRSISTSTRDEIALAYYKTGDPLFSTHLPGGFGDLQEYEGVPGVYCFESSTGKLYVV